MKTVLGIVLCFIFLIENITFAQPYAGKERPKIVNISKAAICTPPNFTTIVSYNNVRMMVHTAGNLWQTPGQNTSMYEIPKNSGINALFTSALWMGGTDVNGQLKLAALRYRDGQDYWTGPLSEGAAEISKEECYKYDKHFESSQDKVREFNAWYEQGMADQTNGTNLQSTKFPGYKIPEFFKNWPAHGNVAAGQDYYLAPFFDRNQDGNYDYNDGDYPWYDINLQKDCKTDRRVSLFGDFNLWWVMNDKGNIHTESGGEPIGMEIRAQAFCFATNDDINNMTFYNYELINRGTTELYNTYFGVMADGALGNPFDDFTGCDVNRGLGYFYNGDSDDQSNSGFNGYGSSPPAVGIDFFEGPYQDNDSIDNGFGIGTNEALNGIGYGDGIVDNERFGMRRFVYYNNTGGGANPNTTDPINSSDYYNFLRGFWKDGTSFLYGGNGYIGDPDANPAVEAAFMFPGDTDPLGWGTGGNPQPSWTEETAGNIPFDRRFAQSAGPFVLKAGAVNNITTGVAWARSYSGQPFLSVKELQRADDKAQALFENCFRVLEGPHAPDLTFQELDREVLLYLDNAAPSNNIGETYEEFDPFIVTSFPNPDKFYRFQGYMMYQLVNDEVSSSDLSNPTKARLVAQCDIKDGVKKLVNFTYNADLNANIPSEEVNGEDEGIKHSFSVKEDFFATGANKRLVNFKRYYYMAIAYAHNNFSSYDPADPGALQGQKVPFLSSRKAAIGEIKVITVIPHASNPEANGTALSSYFGMQPMISRLDGTGNGSLFTRITSQSESEILSNGYANEIEYQTNSAPINVKVIDPLNVVKGYFTCKFYPDNQSKCDSSDWVIYHYSARNGTLIDSVNSDKTIAFDNEQLIPKWGISVNIYNIQKRQFITGNLPEYRQFPDAIGAEVIYNDPSKSWLTFVNDNDSYSPNNWIRSGTFNPTVDPANDNLGLGNPECYPDRVGVDPEFQYEKLLNGGITHFSLTGEDCNFMPMAYPSFFTTLNSTKINGSLARASGVDIVITSDKSKWTRCAVIELCGTPNFAQGNAEAGTLRKSLSLDINGNQIAGSEGMSWFPGYAIDVESGKRLHMAFGENSSLTTFNGRDMQWNPTEELYDANGTEVFGGQHPIYVFGVGINGTACPFYDGTNDWVYDQFNLKTNVSYRDVYTNCMWVVNPLLQDGQKFLSSDARISVRLNQEYASNPLTNLNNGFPLFGWSMDAFAVDLDNQDARVETLEMINVVPNPYYAFSEYERNRLDTRIKITNLPQVCTVSIFNSSGKLVNQFKKDNDLTFIDWNLYNFNGIFIASGVYIIHVEVPKVGETIRKAYISMRQVDTNGL